MVLCYMKCTLLIGPMGAGKSTIGRHLAQQLHLDFYDSDRWMFYQILRSNDFNKVYWIGWHDVKITSKFKQKYMVFQ